MAVGQWAAGTLLLEKRERVRIAGQVQGEPSPEKTLFVTITPAGNVSSPLGAICFVVGCHDA